jgi:hypothetical protein
VNDGRAYGPRAYVERDFARFGVAVHLFDLGDDTVGVAEPIDTVMTSQPRDTGASIAREPWLRLPEAYARALYDALAEHFGGYQGVRSLRADYDAERKRVDLMIETLRKVAELPISLDIT